MTRRFEGRKALVTGASRGIGRAIAVALAREGAAVAVNYRKQQQAAQETVDQCHAAGATAVAVHADVTGEADVHRLIAETTDRLGGLDILICNAGIVRDQLIGAMTLTEWEEVMAGNVRSVFLCIREALPQMLDQKHGVIVTLSSVAAHKAGRGHGNYAASKAGVEALTKSLALELARKKIRINAVAPGIVPTDMSSRVRLFAEEEILKGIPLRRYGTPEEVAAAVCFLASDDAAYITGAVLTVDGGFSL
jgi:3-oxoacyl-[acyl-carrier protein] reductase